MDEPLRARLETRSLTSPRGVVAELDSCAGGGVDDGGVVDTGLDSPEGLALVTTDGEEGLSLDAVVANEGETTKRT